MARAVLLALSVLLSMLGTWTHALQLGNFLRSTNETLQSVPLNASSVWMEGITHYRLLPGEFPKGMNYQFDGLATVMQFAFGGGNLTYSTVRYRSNLEQHYGNCIYEGTGTGPTIGLHSCLTNPGVNLLPINNQLWLTTDTSGWGRVDPDTLATVAAKAEVPSTVLNAHPACDASTNECFVQYPCSAGSGPAPPITALACVGLLQTGDTDIKVTEISRLKLPKAKLIQHSHSPCITPNFLVSKLDSFAKRDTPPPDAGGILKLLHQYEDNMWLLMDRRTNTSRLLYSNVSFVNNHFWNCVERDNMIVVDTVAATGNYLDTYFRSNLQKPTNWTNMFQRPQRCRIPTDGATGTIECSDLLAADSSVVFDYPTFNPYYKMNPMYQFTYGIAPVSPGSQWFDRLLKLDASGHINTQWSEEGVYLTEATFIPRSALGREDDGVLASVIYRSATDSSSLALFAAEDLKLVDEYPMDQVVPFHAHGISCNKAGRCFTNP